jgi:hypothetical protein
MNGSAAKIEIFEPFGKAYALTRKILFQPFDFTKWLVIGFAAFLAGFSGGFNFNYNNRWNKGQDWHTAFFWNQQGGEPAHLAAWLIPVIIIVGVIVVILALLLMWLGARGRFIFIDCIVHNRAAIAAPWREFRTQGNSFFFFSIIVSLIFLGIAAAVALPFVIPLIRNGDHISWSAGRIISAIFCGVILLVAAMCWHFLAQLMAPLMYRRRCRSVVAFKEVIDLAIANPIPLILYALFFVVLVLAVVVIGFFATCLTCCIAAIPYVGTVLLLPLHVILYAFTLLFLRQFGNEYDVWGGGPLPTDAPPLPPAPPPSPSPPAPPTEPPPVQT